MQLHFPFIERLLPCCIRSRLSAPIQSLCAVTVCVHYTEELQWALQNRCHFNRWIIVTSPEDIHTQHFCQKNNLEYIISHRLTEGRVFNKGKAINEGLKYLGTADWIVLLDSDIILPKNFRATLQNLRIDRRSLYSAPRVLCSNAAALLKYQANPATPMREVPLLALWSLHAAFDPTINDELMRTTVPFIGYFQLFHASTGYRYPEQYPTAGDSDLEFMQHFPPQRRHILPMECAHLGMPFQHHKGKKISQPPNFISIGACNGLLEWRGVGMQNSTNGDAMLHRVQEYGWRGILVEPNPSMFWELCQTYAGIDGIILENIAIAEESGERDFYVCHANPLISSFSLEHIRKHEIWCKESWASTVERIRVRCMTVEELLRKHGMEKIDVLHIDAEGHDGKILRSIDWSKLRPSSVYYEHLHLDDQEKNECAELLGRNGYTVVQPNPWNTLAQLPGSVLGCTG